MLRLNSITMQSLACLAFESNSTLKCKLISLDHYFDSMYNYGIGTAFDLMSISSYYLIISNNEEIFN